MTKKFQKKVEDFICEVCGQEVKGNGYTDHCPSCLSGKHVDINPGDRASKCMGRMLPIDYKTKGTKIKLKYQCQKCSHVFWVKSAPNDNLDVLLKIGHKNLP